MIEINNPHVAITLNPSFNFFLDIHSDMFLKLPLKPVYRKSNAHTSEVIVVLQ